MRFSTLSAAALALGLATTPPALSETLVIKGRASQALHCSTMMMVVGALVHEAGMITDNEFDWLTLAAVTMMEHVPGTDAQKEKAMMQRADKIIGTRTVDQLADEFGSTVDWCTREFL